MILILSERAYAISY